MKLRVDPEPNDSKYLVNFHPYRRADVGEYRIIYRIDKTTLVILLVGKRNDDEVYRKMRRLLKQK